MSAKVCLITGGSRGIGLATARRFARGGYAVAIVARTQAPLEAAASELRSGGATVEALAADLGNPAECRRVVDATVSRFGRVDCVVNNAGLAVHAALTETSDADYEQSVRLLIGAVFHMTRSVWPQMQRQGGGTIVNLSSVASVDPFPGFALYGPCKTWVNAFTTATAQEGAEHKIRVLAVAPGAVETTMLRGAFPDYPREQTLDPDEVAAKIEACLDPRIESGSTIFVRK